MFRVRGTVGKPMIQKFAEKFAELEKDDYKVVEIYMNRETLDWFLMFHPEHADGLWGAEIVVVPYKRNRVQLEGRFTGSFGPYRATRHFYVTGNYSSVSVSSPST